MITVKKIKAHYELTSAEEKLLGELASTMKKHRDRFGTELMAYFLSHEFMADFFPTEAKQNHHAMTFAGWFMRLFSGTYDEAYFQQLRKVGRVHVGINLDGHLVNSTMTKVRQFLTEVIEQDIPAEDREKVTTAITKILDINLDVLTSSYRQAELKKYFLNARAESILMSLLERFTHGLNLVLGMALVVVSLAVVWLFIQDVANIFRAEHLETGVVGALGSLLIIWMMIELLGTEIQHLRGRHIPITIFIGIVIVAFIRKVLIGSLQHANPGAQLTTLMDYGTRVFTLLLLAVVYWLISHADRGK
ncbi:MAG: protoglobin domain-containing protein [bacterium]|nr:protoglobin domain-containing protein [bacterium]MDT8395687.1 protoglobin domain-containing protein [bacterium]